MTRRSNKCKLDTFQCLSLSQVVEAFCSPIKQEHAWAVIYQAVTSLLGVVGKHASSSARVCYLVRGMEDIKMTKEGFIHHNTFTLGEGNRVSMTSMATGVAELGVAIYEALDWSVSQDVSVERTLSTELENVFDVMTSADDINLLDEGIGEVLVTSRLCEKVLDLCRHHLAVPDEAAEHYQHVCRALVAEALELANFMVNLSIKDLEELEALDRQEWAGIFNEVMSELRRGVKLKAVEYTRTPTEFALTPYELLMYDIKHKKTELKRPIPVHVEKAAKDRILEAIRSRPPLKPMEKRKLKSPKQDEETPIGILMNEIRRGTARMSLRKTIVKKRKECNVVFGQVVSKVIDTDKRVIDLDESFAKAISNFEESPDNSMDMIPSSPESSAENVFYCNDYEVSESVPNASATSVEVDKNEPKPDPDPCQLSLEEVGRIRSQITLADMERQEMSKQARKDYSKGRICFHCAKTKFNMFNWAYPCQLCKKEVCKTCCNKIRLPSLKLADISVSSIKSQLNLDQEKRSIDERKPSFGGGWQRSSLRYKRNSVQDDQTKLARSKTVTKAEIDKMKEKAFNAATEALGTDHTVCSGCKELLASMVGGRKGSKSPRKKSILDLQTLTISKRKSSSNK